MPESRMGNSTLIWSDLKCYMFTILELITQYCCDLEYLYLHIQIFCLPVLTVTYQGYEEVDELNETGKLRELLKHIPVCIKILFNLSWNSLSPLDN